TDVERAIALVFQVTRTRPIDREGDHPFLIVWPEKFFKRGQAILPVPAELISKQWTLAIQLIPEVNRILGHCTLRRFEVATEDRVNASVVVEVFGIYPERTVIGNAVEVVPAKISHDVVDIPIFVKVSAGNACPQSHIVFKPCIFNTHQSGSVVPEYRQRHKFARYKKVDLSIAVVIGPKCVGNHSGKNEVTTDRVRSIFKQAPLIDQYTTSRRQRVGRRYDTPCHKQIKVAIAINIGCPNT